MKNIPSMPELIEKNEIAALNQDEEKLFYELRKAEELVKDRNGWLSLDELKKRVGIY